MAVQPLSPATDRRLGEPLPHQLPNRTRAHLRAIKSLIPAGCPPSMLCGISDRFQPLFPSRRQVAHVLLTRPPLNYTEIHPKTSSSIVPFDLHVSGRQVAHALLTRPPLEYAFLGRSLVQHIPVRLACVRRAASVRPEPGSNS